MKRRNFIVTLMGGLAASLGIRAQAKPELKAIRHTILPPPRDTTGWRQYVTIDPADARHAISWWARSDPPKRSNVIFTRPETAT
jgi:hypothetical protein